MSPADRTLRGSHLADLARSKITREQAIVAGIHSLTAEVVSQKVGYPVQPAGYILPYPGTKDFRIRLDSPHIAKDGRPAKYLSAKGAEPRLYIPSGVLEALAEDPQRRLVVTEGGKKTIATFLHAGELVVGVAGVWGWRTKKRESGIIADLVRLVPLLHRREVIIGFDSDARSNLQVTHAAAALAEWLQEHAKAKVTWAFPQPNPMGEKQGLDDLLVAENADAVRLLLDQAVQPSDPVAFVLWQRVMRVSTEETKPFAGSSIFCELVEILLQAAASIRPSLAEEVRKKLELSVQDRTALLAAVRESSPGQGAGGDYEETPEGIYWNKQTQSGPTTVPLTNFQAHIVSDLQVDDGVETTRRYEITAELRGRSFTFTVPVSNFAGMTWVGEHLGAEAVLYASFAVKDHVRVAIQVLSEDIVRRSVFSHTGWRLVGDRWTYLHAGGGIDHEGAVENIDVELPSALSPLELPAPEEGENLSLAVKASLGFLDLAPDCVTVPILSAVYRAPLGNSTVSVHLAGKTGGGKTALAAVALQHFGKGFDPDHLPGNWQSTPNALEALAFHAKNALFVVDDFVPAGGGHDASRLHRDADRFLRAQGNHSGRQRMRADTTLRASKPPRGLVLSTGEDVPRGKSLRARLMVLELGKGELDFDRLTEAQKAAAAGTLAVAMASYLQWLAANYEQVQADLKSDQDRIRSELTSLTGHRRTPANLATLAVGFETFVKFALEVGAVSGEDAEEFRSRARVAFAELADLQADHLDASEPSLLFLRLLNSALSGRRCHVAGVDGGVPIKPGPWGWMQNRVTEEWRPCGPRVGWIDEADLYLDMTTAFAAVQAVGRDTGEEILLSVQMLKKDLFEANYLATIETRGKKRRYEVRKTLEGRRRPVLHLKVSSLFEKVAQVAQNAVSPTESGHELGHSAEEVAQPGGPENRDSSLIGPLGPLFEGRKGHGESRDAEAADDEVEL